MLSEKNMKCPIYIEKSRANDSDLELRNIYRGLSKIEEYLLQIKFCFISYLFYLFLYI